MRYMQLTRIDQETMLAELSAMPHVLETAFGCLPAADVALPGPGGAFSPVEHAWHLADLEREGYAVRIERLLNETAPALPDFDGARIARGCTIARSRSPPGSMPSAPHAPPISPACARSRTKRGSGREPRKGWEPLPCAISRR